jgi:hypothetical protein
LAFSCADLVLCMLRLSSTDCKYIVCTAQNPSVKCRLPLCFSWQKCDPTDTMQQLHVSLV